MEKMKKICKTIKGDRQLLAGMIGIVILLALVILAPVVASENPHHYGKDILNSLGQNGHLLGTNHMGQDIYSMIPGSKSRRKAGRSSRSRHSHDLARARDSTLGFCEERQGARHWRCCGQRCGERRRRRGDLRGIRCQGIWSAGDRAPHADAGDCLRTQFEDRRSDG